MFLINNKLGIIWSLVIVGVCLIPGKNLPETSFLDGLGIDKIIHAFFYLVLILLVTRGLLKPSNYSFSRNKAIVVAFLYCAFFGIGIEFMQSAFVASRTGDVFDVLANNIGAFIGVLIILKYTKRKTEKV